MMFPEGNHYAAGSGKVNDMIAYRSSDNGKSWKGPTIAFDIECDRLSNSDNLLSQFHLA